jgi:AraC family transcriptional regulator of arabinose operon
MAEDIRNPAALAGRLPPPGSNVNVHEPPGLESGIFDQDDRYGALRARGTRTWLLFHCVGGAGYFRGADGRAVAALPGDVALWEPRTFQDYGVLRGSRWRFHWVHFEPRPAWAGGWLALPRVPEVPGLRRVHLASAAARRRVTAVFTDLHRDVRLGGAWRTEAAMNALERVLIAAHESLRTGGGRPLDPRIVAAVERIAARPGERYTVAGLAREAHLSPSRFAHVFRAQSGQSVIGTVLGARMREAAKLLVMTPMPVKEIADALGFSSQFHFSQTFRRRMGRSPREWRRRSAGSGGR